MSIMRMRRNFAQHLKLIMWVILAVFLIGIPLSAFYFGGGLLSGAGGGNKQTSRAPGSDIVLATVGGERLTAAQLDAAYTSALQQAAYSSAMTSGIASVPFRGVLQPRYEALQQVARTLLVAQTARKRGLTVSGSEVDAAIEQQVQEAVKSIGETATKQKADPRSLYREFMRKNGEERARVSEDDFREWMRDFLNQRARSDLQRSLLITKLQQQVVAAIRVSDADVDASFDEAKLDTIMVLVEGSGAAADARAKKQADAFYAKLKAGQSFSAVKKQSSGASAAPGESWLSRTSVSGMYGPDAEKTVFALAPGGFSAPVKLPGAYVIFLVKEKRRTPPADLAKKKSDIRKSLLAQRQAEAWRTAEAEITKGLKIVSKAPQISGLQAYAAGKRAKAIAEFEKAVSRDASQGTPADVYVAMCYEVAQDKLQKKQYAEAREFLDLSLTPPGTFPQGLVSGFPDQIHLAMGQAALEQGDTAQALRDFQEAGAGEDFIVHMSLLTIYEKLGDQKLVKQEQQWLDEYRQMQKEQEEAQKAAEAEIEKERAAAAKAKTPPATAAPKSPETPAKTSGAATKRADR